MQTNLAAYKEEKKKWISSRKKKHIIMNHIVMNQ